MPTALLAYGVVSLSVEPCKPDAAAPICHNATTLIKNLSRCDEPSLTHCFFLLRPSKTMTHPEANNPQEADDETVSPVVSAHTMARIRAFRDDRNWRQFHNPKDLAISITLEAAELLECFQWSGADTEAAAKRDAMKEELSDVMIYALLLADRLGIDMDKAIAEKLLVNERKYPVAESYGSSAKYAELKRRARVEASSENA